MIELVITRDPRRPRRPAYVITSGLRLGASEVFESFAQRSTIEQHFTIAKSHLGLGTAELRKERPVLRNATFCMGLLTSATSAA